MKNNLNKLETKYLLALLAAAAVKRKNIEFEKIIESLKAKKIGYRKIYEVLLQNYLFAGYPNAMVSLKKLKEFFPQKLRQPNSDMNLYHFKKIGEKNCKTIYGNKYKKLVSNVNDFSPDLSKWLVLEGYGKVLGRKGLSLKQREFCIVSVLSALKYSDQLYSHIIGAFNCGGSVNEIKGVITNLRLLGLNLEAKFGMKLFEKYLIKKGIR